MSVFLDYDLPCPACGTDVTFDVCHSINVDRRQDLRDEIIEGSFQREKCGSCGKEFRMEPEFTYLDLGRKQWLAAKPIDQRGEWQSVEADVQNIYDIAFGKRAPAAAQQLGKGVQARLVFGWAGVTEKIAANEFALDDVALEIVKVGLLRNIAGHRFSGDTELRFAFADDGADGPALVFNWYQNETGEFQQSVRVPRSLYDDIAGNPFEPLRPQVAAGLFVDMQRLYVPSA